MPGSQDDEAQGTPEAPSAPQGPQELSQTDNRPNPWDPLEELPQGADYRPEDEPDQ